MGSRGAPGTNWAGTHRYQARGIFRAETEDDVVGLVSSGREVRALGTRHSFNDLADTTGLLVDVKGVAGRIEIDEDHQRVRVPAGMTYGALSESLQSRGWALHNLGSLPHISVAGACATGTHGSGATNGSLATAVSGLDLIAGRGRRVHVGEDDPRFAGVVVALGALGIVTSLTLRIEPTYEMRQRVFLAMPWSELADLDGVMRSAYSVSLFTRWRGVVDQVWVKSKGVDEAQLSSTSFRGAAAATTSVSPTGDDPGHTTAQRGLPGPWNQRLPHFHLDRVPSRGDEIQSEYFVAREAGPAVLGVLEEMSDVFGEHLIISELRYVASDTLWLSPAHGRDSLAVHFTWMNHPLDVRRILALIEKELAPFAARPHWGKWFVMDATRIATMYERRLDFISLVNEFDPDRQFTNAYLDRVLYGEPGG